jgi:hypothetical protein
MEHFDITLTLIDASLKNLHATEVEINSIQKRIKKSLAEEARAALKDVKSKSRSIDICKLQIKVYENQINNIKPLTMVRSLIKTVRLRNSAYKLASSIAERQKVHLDLALIKARVLDSIKRLSFRDATHMMKKISKEQDNRRKKILGDIQHQKDVISKLRKKRVDTKDYLNYLALSKKWHCAYEALTKRRKECVLKFKVKSIEDTCPICIETDDNLIKTKCGHYYHGECISELIGNTLTNKRFGSVNVKCPMCRQDLIKIMD